MKIKNELYFLIILLLTSCATKKPEIIKYSESNVSQPEKFGAGIISTSESSEFNLYFTPNGRTVYFTRRKGDEKQKIWTSEFKDNNWTNPSVAVFSTDRDETPFVSTDGKTIYFGSSRPIVGRPSKGNFDMNIWMTEWINNKWGNPIPLNESINAVQQENEEWPSSNENFIFSLDGKSFLYTTMLRGDNSINIYEVNKTGEDFSTPKKINGLFESEKTWKYSAVMSPDGNFLFFNSYNADDGFGGEDIYVSKKMAEGWSRAKNIGAIINTSAQESSPRFSPDGKYFFFGREFRENPEKDGIWNIFFIETKYLNLNELF